MRYFTEVPENRADFPNAVVTIGSFDGVHRGHQAMFTRLIEEADKIQGTPVVVTFSNHPRRVLNPEFALSVLTTRDEKIRAIFDAGIDTIIALTFTPAMAEMSARDFLREFLVTRLDIQKLVIGHDHAFGKNREGDSAYLRRFLGEFAIGLVEVDEEFIEGRSCSSSIIRGMLASGDVAGAALLLGRQYHLTGTVVAGAGRGRELGFPTANIRPLESAKAVPGPGVYAVMVSFDGLPPRKGVCSIGTNPTFSGTDVQIEVHVPGFSGVLYGNEAELSFYAKVRDMRRFPTPGDLQKQIHHDIKTALTFFG